MRAYDIDLDSRLELMYCRATIRTAWTDAVAQQFVATVDIGQATEWDYLHAYDSAAAAKTGISGYFPPATVASRPPRLTA